MRPQLVHHAHTSRCNVNVKDHDLIVFVSGPGVGGRRQRTLTLQLPCPQPDLGLAISAGDLRDALCPVLRYRCVGSVEAEVGRGTRECVHADGDIAGCRREIGNLSSPMQAGPINATTVHQRSYHPKSYTALGATLAIMACPHHNIRCIHHLALLWKVEPDLQARKHSAHQLSSLNMHPRSSAALHSAPSA